MLACTAQTESINNWSATFGPSIIDTVPTICSSL